MQLILGSNKSVADWTNHAASATRVRGPTASFAPFFLGYPGKRRVGTGAQPYGASWTANDFCSRRAHATLDSFVEIPLSIVLVYIISQTKFATVVDVQPARMYPNKRSSMESNLKQHVACSRGSCVAYNTRVSPASTSAKAAEV